jgi:hypothetical protein
LSKLFPHIIAVVVFLIVAVIYCRPALQGMVLQQSDITHWKGAIHESQIYKETHGEYPLWTNALFSGMPAFQIGYPANNVVPWIVHRILTLQLPVPIQFFFLACICFYFLALCLRVKPYVAILGALAFAYATYNPIIISVGHDTKMWSIAYMPALLGSFLLIYRRKYWIGTALAALFTSVIIAVNHLQITYYIFLTIGIVTLFYFVQWILKKEWKHLVLSAVFAIGATAIGVLTNAVTLFSTYDYQKETIRGGASDLTDTTGTIKSKTGLDKDYALSYSLGISEPFVLMVPRMFGGSSGYPAAIGGGGYREMDESNSKTVETVQNLPRELAQQIAGMSTLYWGGIDGVGTSGPPYVGAIICFLAVLGMFILDNRYKWWAFTAIVLTIMMSWGKYFDTFNTFLYNDLPFYNKFRAPSMIMVIPQLLLPMLAVLCVDRIVRADDKRSLFPEFKKGLIAMGAIFVVLLILYFSFDFLSPEDKANISNIRNTAPDAYSTVKPFFDALAEDRKSLMIGDIFRSLLYILVAAGTLYLIIRKILKPVWAVVLLTVFAFVDVISIDSKYLNVENYQDEEENMAGFVKSPADEEILKDTSFYRVFNFSPSAFSESYTSYYYNSVGGYHPAKLKIYQDLIERQLSKSNMNVLNMLNTKYFIQKDERGITQKYQRNDSALGNCWFVKSIKFVKNDDEEMAALDHFNPADTAVIQESFHASIPILPQADSNASIRLVKNDNDKITYTYSASANQFAVFSEIYYPRGWKAFMDGKELAIVKVNYVLRGLALPPGQHTIEFRFEPESYKTGRQLTTIFSVLLLLLLTAGAYFEWKSNRTSAAKA